MDIGETIIEDVRVTELGGRLNAAAVNTLAAHLSAAHEAAPRDSLIDMRHVAYIGHSGLKALLSHARAVHATSDRLVLVNVSNLVFSVFDMYGCVNEFEYAADRDDGIAMLRGGDARAPVAPAG